MWIQSWEVLSTLKAISNRALNLEVVLSILSLTPGPHIKEEANIPKGGLEGHENAAMGGFATSSLVTGNFLLECLRRFLSTLLLSNSREGLKNPMATTGAPNSLGMSHS